MNMNACCYLGLAGLSLALLIYVFVRKKDFSALLVFLAMIGFGYIVEYIIYVLLDSYEYYPKLLRHDAYYDSSMGAIASNMLALPATATFLALFGMGWIAAIVCAGLFVGVEWTFLYLGIYKHHWWRIGYTAVTLPFYFRFATYVFHKMKQPLSGFLHGIMLFFIIGAVLGTMQFMPVMLFNTRSYTVGWFDNVSRDTNAFGGFYYLSISLFFVAIVKVAWGNVWWKTFVAIGSILVVKTILARVGILHSLVWWDYGYYFIVNTGVFMMSYWLNRRLKRGET